MVIQRTIVLMRKPHPLYDATVYATAIVNGLLLFCTGIGLLKFKNWSRIVAIYLNIYFIVLLFFLLVAFEIKLYKDVVALLLFALVNIYFIFPIYYFTRPKVKQQFK